MISELLIPMLLERFPGRGIRVGSRPAVVIPAIHPEFGDIEVFDDDFEVTLVAGKFTHGHFSNYEKDISVDEKEKTIAEDVAEFLEKVFADQVVFWGSHKGGGGWRVIDADLSEGRIPPADGYLWSGPRRVP